MPMLSDFTKIKFHKQAISVKDILEAMADNGYEQIGTGRFIEYKDGKVTGACALGQAALNLKVRPIDIYTFLNDVIERDNDRLGDYIARVNDYLTFSVSEIAQTLMNDLHEVELNKYIREFTVFDDGLQFEGTGGLL